MGFFLLMIGVIILLNIIMPPPGIPKINPNVEKRCPNHKWEYFNGFLRCDYCHKTPDEIVKGP